MSRLAVAEELSAVATSNSYEDLDDKPTQLYLQDANGKFWRLTVSTLGVIVPVDAGTDPPEGAIIGAPLQ